MSIRERAIGLIGGYSPPLLWWRAKRPRWAWEIHSQFGKPTSRYVDQQGLSIGRGGFEGLRFPPEAIGHTNYLGAKLAGVYEPEVVEFLAGQADSHELFVDLGSGDGFFLTGLGRLNPQLRLIGYEVNRYERDLAARIAEANGVSAEFRSLADQRELKGLPAGKLLLLCDLEGLEEDLLDPDDVDRLREATMLVEAHSQFRPDVVPTLTSRFEKTHEVNYFSSSRTDPGTLPELADWPREESEIVLNDGHDASEGWMTFVPRHEPVRGGDSGAR